MRKPAEKPKQPLPSWTERFNCHSLSLAGGFVNLGVNWSIDRTKPGYRVEVNHTDLKNPIENFQEAQRAAILLARRKLAQASAELDALSPETRDLIPRSALCKAVEIIHLFFDDMESLRGDPDKSHWPALWEEFTLSKDMRPVLEALDGPRQATP